MRMRLFFLAVVVSVVLAAVSPVMVAQAAQSMSRQIFTEKLFEFLDEDPVDCPAEVAELDAGDKAQCVDVALEWKPFEKKMRSFTRKQLPDDPLENVPWAREKGYRSRYVVVSDGTLSLVLDAEAGWLAVVPGHSCFDSAKLEALKIQEAGCGGVSWPRVEQRVRPIYPEAARIEQAGGVVLVEAIVLEDGSAGDVCVLYESRRGFGFAEAAVEAVSSYRFEPARKDGTIDDRGVLQPLVG